MKEMVYYELEGEKMGRCKFTTEQIEQMKRNPNVLNVNEERIMYSLEFKRHFIDEYKKGITPKNIFKAAGFDTDILGAKRIQRASERWRKANDMMCYHEYIQKNWGTKNERDYLRQLTAMQKAIERLEAENGKLKRRNVALEAEGELLKKNWETRREQMRKD